MNNWNNQYSYNNWDRPTTNIQYVTSLDEALSRSNMRGSENIYFHQDQPVFYRIKVEQDGRKYWQEFSYTSNQVDNTPVVKQDLLMIDERLKYLENLLLKKENVTNEQPNGQVSINDFATSASTPAQHI